MPGGVKRGRGRPRKYNTKEEAAAAARAQRAAKKARLAKEREEAERKAITQGGDGVHDMEAAARAGLAGGGAGVAANGGPAAKDFEHDSLKMSKAAIIFVRDLRAFHEAFDGKPFRWPTMGRKDIDLRLLLVLVYKMGGPDRCSRKKKWRKIGRSLNLTLSTSSSTALRIIYLQMLEPFLAHLLISGNKKWAAALGLPASLMEDDDGGDVNARHAQDVSDDGFALIPSEPLAPAQQREEHRRDREVANGTGRAPSDGGGGGGDDDDDDDVEARALGRARAARSGAAARRGSPDLASDLVADEEERDADSDCEIFEPTGDSVGDALRWLKLVAAGGSMAAGGAAQHACKDTLLRIRVARSVVRASSRSRRTTSAWREAKQTLAMLNSQNFVWPRLGPEFQALHLPVAAERPAVAIAPSEDAMWFGTRLGAEAPKPQHGAGAAGTSTTRARAESGERQQSAGGIALWAPPAMALAVRKEQGGVDGRGGRSAADVGGPPSGAPSGADVQQMPQLEQRKRACEAARAALHEELGPAAAAMCAGPDPDVTLSADEAEAFDTALRERGKSFHTFDDVLPERAISEVIAHYFNVYKIDACVAKRNKKAAEKAAGKQTAPPELSASQQKPYALELGSPKRLLVAVRPTPPA